MPIATALVVIWGASGARERPIENRSGAALCCTAHQVDYWFDLFSARRGMVSELHRSAVGCLGDALVAAYSEPGLTSGEVGRLRHTLRESCVSRGHWARCLTARIVTALGGGGSHRR